MLKNAPVVPYIPATDIPRARRFYEEQVGLVAREAVAGGVVYECANGSWIFLCQSARVRAQRTADSGERTADSDLPTGRKGADTR